MATIEAKAFRVTETSRPILQMFVQEPIPEETKYVLASPEGYLFFDEDIPMMDENFVIRFPRMTMLSYHDLTYESE